MEDQRQQPRPKYYSASSGQEITISYEFESYVINLTDAQKSSVISRLRKAIQTSNKRSIRDDLAYQALDIEASNCGGVKQELTTTLGESASYESDTISSNGDIGEVALMVDDMASGYALPMFQYDEAKYGLVYNALLRDSITNNDNSDAAKKELSSWIDIIQQYMTA